MILKYQILETFTIYLKILMHYKHTQISYPMIMITLAMLGFFTWIQIMSRLETPSPDSGTNLGMTSVMILILAILASFTTLKTSIDDHYIHIKFGYGIYHKSFALSDIQSVKAVRNHRYYGWGIKVWFRPKMWIYSVTGFDAVELTMKDGKIYRIWTNDQKNLVEVVKNHIK